MWLSRCDCESMCVEVIIIMSVGVPKRLTHGMPHTHTHTQSHTHNLTYQRLRSTICTRDTVSYDCRAHSLAHCRLSFLFCCSVWTSSVLHAVYLLNCVCGWYDRNLGAHTHGRAAKYIYFWSVRTETSLSPISLITHKVPTTRTRLPPLNT